MPGVMTRADAVIRQVAAMRLDLEEAMSVIVAIAGSFPATVSEALGGVERTRTFTAATIDPTLRVVGGS